MFSQEFEKILRLTVKPIGKIDPYILQYSKKLEIVSIYILGKNYSPEYYSGLREAIRNKIEIMLLESNHKHLVEFQDLIGINKQLGYIESLKTVSTINKDVLLIWEENFKLLENRLKANIIEKKEDIEKRAAAKKSYKFICNDFDIDIKKLYKLLRGKIIKYDTTLEQVINVFNEVELSKISPIRWKEDNTAELVFFYLALMDNGFIERENRNNWSRLGHCFVKPDGTKFKNLKNYKSPLLAEKEGILSINKIETINKILASVLN